MSYATMEPEKETTLTGWLISELRESARRIGEMEATVAAAVRYLHKEQEDAARDMIRRGDHLDCRAFDTTVWVSDILAMLRAGNSYDAMQMIEDEAKRRAEEMAKEAEYGDAE